MQYHLFALVIAYIVDWIVGDPPNWPHPVKGFGKLIQRLDGWLNKGWHRKLNGFIMVMVVVVTVFISSLAIVLGSYILHPILGVIVEGVLIATTISVTSLKKAVMQVYVPLKDGDLVQARRQLSYIVGRDTDNLAKTEVIRGAVETVAENTSDGITAPLFWGLIGGAPFALVYRAVNTCDSMVGYQNEKYQAFGYAAAKLDDILNYLPARLTAFVMLLLPVKEVSRKQAFAILRRDARKHESPNSGWGEVAVAARFGIQLGGVNYYQGKKSASPTLGVKRTNLTPDHIPAVVRMMQQTTLLFLLLLLLGGILIAFAITWI